MMMMMMMMIMIDDLVPLLRLATVLRRLLHIIAVVKRSLQGIEASYKYHVGEWPVLE